ncbi:MAG: hypothetical protein QW689_05525 [Nitrososphaerota archaeon]
MAAEDDLEELNNVLNILREIILSLQKFLETDDYKFIENAYSSCSKLLNIIHIDSHELAGKMDLVKNIESMYDKVRYQKNNFDLENHGLLVQQAVYTITRANIMAVGLEFKIKRTKG